MLGIGAFVTMAAWNDSEFADGAFTTGQFNLEGSTDGSTYEQHSSSETSAELEFAADNLVPGETVYAPFWVRLDSATTVDGTILAENGLSVVDVSNSGDGDNSDALSYDVFHIEESANCGSAAVGGETAIASAGSFSEGGIGPASNIALASNGAGNSGDAVQLCFQVTADNDDLAQATTTTITWEVTATSNDAD